MALLNGRCTFIYILLSMCSLLSNSSCFLVTCFEIMFDYHGKFVFDSNGKVIYHTIRQILSKYVYKYVYLINNLQEMVSVIIILSFICVYHMHIIFLLHNSMILIKT